MGYAPYVLAFGLVLGTCLQLVHLGLSVDELPSRDYATVTCDLEPYYSNRPTLRVLDGIYFGAGPLLDTLCGSPQLGAHFSAVEIHSVQRDTLDLRLLYDLTYELVLAKPELFKEVTRLGGHYFPVALYPDYSGQLISLKSQPSLNPEWWRHKHLGLIDDPYSVSGYQIPKLTLQRHGLQHLPSITYYPTHRELYTALQGGLVDVIATAAVALDDTQPEYLTLELEDHISGPSWFLRNSLLETPVHCAVAGVLEELSRHTEPGYLRNLQIVRPCDD